MARTTAGVCAARTAAAAVALALLVAVVGAAAGAQPPAGVTATTFAGSGEEGFLNGAATIARFSHPRGMAAGPDGALYVVDNARIRRVAPSGVVTTPAGGDDHGFVDATSGAARFDSPSGLAVGADGTVYVADAGNHRIRAIGPDSGVTTLAGTGEAGFADGAITAARFNNPAGIAVDGAGTLYVADSLNHCIRRISGGEVTTFAGACGGDSGDFADGPAAVARFSFPLGIAVAGDGAVYVADTYNARIRRITPAGEVSTLAGSGEDGSADGPAAVARFSDPLAVAVAPDGRLIVVDKSNRVRVVTPGGAVATLAGTGEAGFADGPGDQARFDGPAGVAVDAAGTVYVADTGNRRIRAIRRAE